VKSEKTKLTGKKITQLRPWWEVLLLIGFDRQNFVRQFFRLLFLMRTQTIEIAHNRA
jgi:hypothetical protein